MAPAPEKVTITDFPDLVEDISSLYLNPKFSDIVLNINGEKLHAHKVILAARSEYFQALLYGDSDKSSAEINLNDVSLNAFKMLIKYIYTSNVSIEPSNIEVTLEVMELAHQYSFRRLESSIIKNLKTILSLENVCAIINIANLYDITDLRAVCHDFMDLHATELLAEDRFNQLTQVSMIKLLERDSFFAPEVDIFKRVAEWCRTNNDNLILKCVRLSWLTVVEIVSLVWPSKLVDNEILINAIAEIIAVKPRQAICRAQRVADENVASSTQKSEVITGKNTGFLLNGNRDVTKYVSQNIGDQTGVTIKLGKPSFINHIHMMLWDSDTRYYCYYIEVSLDQRKWKRVVDYRHCSCRSYQILYFEEEIVQYIRVVGTHNSANNEFNLVFFEAHYKTKIPRIVNGFVSPITNVATLDKEAIVIEGIHPSHLLDGNTKNYDEATGYTSHLIDSGPIVIQLAQPYMISSMKLLLWDQDDRFYKFYIQSSLNKTDWETVIDRRNVECRSWQIFRFNEKPMVYIKIIGTQNSANETFHCVHFECPTVEAE